MSHLSQSNTFAITLVQDASTLNYAVRAVDVTAPAFKNRMSFSHDEPIANVFSSVMVEIIEGLRARVNQANMVFSMPDKIVETQGLILGKLRMLVSTNSRGRRNVIIRFAHFIGHFHKAFASRLGFETALESQKKLAETSVFFDIATPVLNIITAATQGVLPDGSKASIDRRLKQLHLDADELRFYLELLQRHMLQNSDETAQLAQTMRISDAG